MSAVGGLDGQGESGLDVGGGLEHGDQVSGAGGCELPHGLGGLRVVAAPRLGDARDSRARGGAQQQVGLPGLALVGRDQILHGWIRVAGQVFELLVGHRDPAQIKARSASASASGTTDLRQTSRTLKASMAHWARREPARGHSSVIVCVSI